MKAEAVAHGAATIINAIATGKGGAFGVDLWSKAIVEITDSPGRIESTIKCEPNENTRLIESAVFLVLNRFDSWGRHGARVETDSNIPIAKGLKSSSAAANAIVLATTAALGQRMSDRETVEIGVKAAKMAGVTKTGAFDDACASYYGNVYITDNRDNSVIKDFRYAEDYTVLFHVPPRKAYTSEVDVSLLKWTAPLVELAHKEAVAGNYWLAMTLNGLVYSAALGYGSHIALEALSKGAVAAGLSGKGPAVAAVVPEEATLRVREAWGRYDGQVIVTGLNREKARVVSEQ